MKLNKEDKKLLKAERKAKRVGVISEFKKFIMRGNVIDMAVGVIVATAFTKIVGALTNGVFMPLITLLVPEKSFDNVKTILRQEVLDANGEVVVAQIALNWGAVIQAVIDFLMIAIIIFTIIKIINSIRTKIDYLKEKLHKEDQKAPVEVTPPAPPAPTTNELLGEIINLLKDNKNE